MKRFYYAVGTVVTVVSIFYFFRSVSTHWQSILSLRIDADNLPHFATAAALYIATYVGSSKAWQQALRCFDVELKLGSALKIIAVSQFAKYLPGNFGHHLGRLLLAKRVGIPNESTLLSIVLDSALVAIAALLCGLPGLSLIGALLRDHDVDAAKTSLSVLSIAVAATIFALSMGRFRNYLHRLIAKYGNFADARKLRYLANNMLMHSINFMLGGAALYVISTTFAPTDLSPYPAFFQVISVYATSWLLGFLLPGAPAGLGVRELCLLLGLSPLIGEQNALLAAAILRLVTTVSDGLVFLIGLILKN